ncbi:MAG: hypothetical protein J7521_07200 [Caulobacter sp.]|nr:hypothetical protein [Caulobacter sp.]
MAEDPAQTSPVAYTFICLGEKQVSTTIDLQVLTPETLRAHALELLRTHGSAKAVEVWSQDGFVETIPRDGVRVWPGPEGEPF